MRISFLSAAVLAGVISASGAIADPVYFLDIPPATEIGGPDTITGTISTNGATGVLSLSDITAVNIVVSDGSSSVHINSPTELLLAGADLTATPSAMFFNYAGTDGGDFEGGSAGAGFCLLAPGGCGTGDLAVGLEALIPPDNHQAFNIEFSNQQIAYVPEPGTLALLAAGLMGLTYFGASMRRRLTSKTA